jgi:hypothetical protein
MDTDTNARWCYLDKASVPDFLAISHIRWCAN